jgi:hypothetical protein
MDENKPAVPNFIVLIERQSSTDQVDCLKIETSINIQFPVVRRAKIFTAEDAEGAETKTEGKSERIGDGGSIASLVFSAFFSAFSASSAVRNDMD